MPGIFNSPVSPGVYTRTIAESSATVNLDGFRIPVFIGVGEENLSRSDFQMVRGSSKSVDNLRSKEDVSSQWITDNSNPSAPVLGVQDGTIRKFQVDHYPIVDGTGSGTVTTNVAKVTVTVDGTVVEVSQLNGTLGVVTLRSAPSETAEVRVTYYFKRTDTSYTDDLSDQADGTNLEFKVFNTPIVDGTDGGITSVDVADVTVEVDGVAVTVDAIDGTTGILTLASAPSNGSEVLVTYSHNTWQDTFDYLLDPNVTSVTRVGFSPGESSYIDGTDYTIKNQGTDAAIIHWGASYTVESDIHSDSAEYFDDTQVTVTLVDTKVYLDAATSYNSSRTVFRLNHVPTLGNGRDTTLGSDVFFSISNGRVDLSTNRPDLITAYVGLDVIDAMKRSPVTVTKVDGASRLITLGTAVQPGESVFATYWTNYLQNDTYTLTVETAGASGTGTYTVESDTFGSDVYQTSYVSKSGVSQTVNWGTGSQTLTGIFHDGSGTPIEEYIQIEFLTESARVAKLVGTVEGPFVIQSGVNDAFSVNGSDVTIPASDPAVVTGTIAQTFNLDGKTLRIRSNQKATFTEIVFVGDTLSAIAVDNQITYSMASAGTLSADTDPGGVVPGADQGILVTVDGSNHIVLTSVDVGDDAYIEIDTVGDALPILGLTAGTTTGASTPTADAATAIAAIAGVSCSVVNDVLAIVTDDPGASESLEIDDISDNAYATLGFEVGQTDQGEGTHTSFNVSSYVDDEFTVASTNGTGTGTTNEGIVGQTYVDEVTGLRISILPPEESALYTDEGIVKIKVLKSFVTSSASPVYAFPGMEVKVSNTTDVGVGDTCVLTSMDKAGNEPSVGDTYYVSYKYAKTNYDAKIFTSMADIIAEYGAISPENRVTLACHIAMGNGASAVAVKQILKVTGTDEASSTSYLTAIGSLRLPIDGSVKPSFIIPLTTDPTVLAVVKNHCILQSSLAYRQERRCIFGFASGTTPVQAQRAAKTYANDHMWPIYPETAVVGITDELGQEVEYVVDGSMIAAAMVGTAVSNAYDVADPYTNRQLAVLKRLVRKLDDVERVQTAAAGITVLVDTGSGVKIQQAMTSDISSVLTREPTVGTIKDLVQQGARTVLNQFIGVKFIGGVTGDIERVMKSYMKRLVDAEIITAFTNIRAIPDPTDPTAVMISLSYSPVLPLNFVVVTFRLTSKGV